MKRSSWVLFLLVLGACSHYLPPPHQAVPLNQRTDTSPNVPYEVTETRAAGALIEQGINLLLSQKKAPVGAIDGLCRIRPTAESNIFIPCQNVVIVLVDLKGNEVSRSHAEEGHFSFSARGKKAFRLKVISKAFQLSAESVGPVGERDSVSLELTPITR